jgi:hypothetical protein
MQCPQCGRTNRNDAKTCFACRADLRAVTNDERPVMPSLRDYSEDDPAQTPIYERPEPQSAPEEEVDTIYQKDKAEEENRIDEIYEYMMPEESEVEKAEEEDELVPIYEDEEAPELQVIYDDLPETAPNSNGASADNKGDKGSKPPPPPDDEDEFVVSSVHDKKQQNYEVVFDDEEEVVFNEGGGEEFEIVQTKDLDPKRASLIALIRTLMSKINTLRHNGKNVKDVEAKMAIILSCEDKDKKHAMAKECLEVINKMECENDQERFQDTARKYHEIRAKLLVLSKKGKDVNAISSLLDDASSAIAMSDFLKAEMLITEIEKKIVTL